MTSQKLMMKGDSYPLDILSINETSLKHANWKHFKQKKVCSGIGDNKHVE